MQIIAESGGTKTDWRILLKDGSIQQFTSSGLNPTYLSNQRMLELLDNELTLIISEPLSAVYFYGAGCHKAEQKENVLSVLKKRFPTAKQIIVDHDLLAAARACSLSAEGIVCILGTGSNACRYDGESIQNEMLNLGYILGDEGSGAYFGKHILKSFFDKTLDAKLSTALKEKFPDLDRDQMIEDLYRKEKPNKYLASFFPFLLEHTAHPYIQKLLVEGFKEFLQKVKNAFPEAEHLPIHFVGGVAFHANPFLRKALQEQKLLAGTIMESPIAGLTLYHRNPKA